MRVTNEEARENAEMPIPAYYDIDHFTVIKLRDSSSDLLEARELIKEMRSALEIVRDNTLNPAHTMTVFGLEETTDANHKLALAILEKSKEYI